jgi:alpha-tubulin suppressor-like RCC1 family protein
MLMLVGGCGRLGFDPLNTSDAPAARPDGTIPTNDGSVDLTCVAQLDAGYQHACVRATDGRVWCWGRSDQYQLGDGFTQNRNYPAPATAFAAPSTMTLGGYVDCQLDATGNVRCVGANYAGQLGIGMTTPSKPTLQPVTLPAAAMQIAGGEEHVCALLVDGRVYCWGNNFYGAIGDGTTMSPRPGPTFTGITTATAIVAGNHHSCALTPTDLLCWGDNQYGELGDGTKMQRRVPTSTGMTGIKAFAGGNHTCIIDTADTMHCWGFNQNGALGNNSTIDSTTPVTPQGLPPVRSIALGYKHTCAITMANDLYCWGQGTFGAIGNNATTDVRVPTQISGAVFSKASFVTAGTDFTCAMDPMEQLFCWGANDQGQLGDATTVAGTMVPTPTLFSCDI